MIPFSTFFRKRMVFSTAQSGAQPVNSGLYFNGLYAYPLIHNQQGLQNISSIPIFLPLTSVYHFTYHNM